MTDTPDNPERAAKILRAVRTYFEHTRGGDAAKWASVFAEDAVVEDPVGTPVHDSPEKILAFGQGIMDAFETVGLHEQFIHVAGLEAAAMWTGRATTHDGQKVSFQGIDTFEFNDDLKITKLRGFWTPPGS